MHGKTHEVVTKCAFSVLRLEDLPVKLPSGFARRLVSENMKLDEKPEYLEEVFVNERGYLRTVRRRVSHHSCSSKHILSKLDKARSEVLKLGTLSPEGVRVLAEALHYVQDRCVPSPAEDYYLHKRIEEAASRLHSVLEHVEVDVFKPIGRKELGMLLRKQPVARNARDAVICAARFTYAVLYAVLANPLEAPEYMVEKAVSVKRVFSGWRLAAYTALALASIITYALLVLTLLKTDVYLLSLAGISLPALYPAFCAVGVFSQNMDTFLHRLRTATEHNLLVFLLPVLSIGLTYSSFLILVSIFSLLTIAVVITPYLSKSFREIRDDITWFIWQC
jgi:hypothetical protein